MSIANQSFAVRGSRYKGSPTKILSNLCNCAKTAHSIQIMHISQL